MQAINPHGRKVGILESQWPALQKKGFKLPEYYQELTPSSKVIVVNRPIGGLGDTICMEPAIRGLKGKYPDCDIWVNLPKKYWSLLGKGADNTFDYHDNIFERFTSGDIRLFVDLDCPCDQYESSTGYRPLKDRTTIFCETARVPSSTPKLEVSSTGIEAAVSWLSRHKVNLNDAIGIQPISAQPQKDWIRFPGLAHVLAERGHTVVVFSEKPLPEIQTHSNIVVAHDIDVDTLVCLCYLMRLIIAPDSACFHIGGALEVPTLGLFGPTNGRLTSRWYTSTEILQSSPFSECPCHFYDPNKNEACLGGSSHCMLQLTMHEVLKKVEDMLCR